MFSFSECAHELTWRQDLFDEATSEHCCSTGEIKIFHISRKYRWKNENLLKKFRLANIFSKCF